VVREQGQPERSGALTRNVDTAQKAPDVSGKRNDHGGQEFQGSSKPETRNPLLFAAADGSRQPGRSEERRCIRGEVEQQQSLQFLALEFATARPKCRLRALATRCQRRRGC